MENKDFDLWCYSAQSSVMMDEHPLPLLTVFLHRVCGSDETNFARGLEILRTAFEAGAALPKQR